MEERLQPGAILRGTAALFAGNPVAAIGALILLSAAGVVSDLNPEMFSILNFGIAILAVVVQYLVTQRALAGAGVPLSDRSNLIISVLGAGIMIGIASGLALLLFIVPGVYLYTRWSITIPIILAEGATASEAMSESRDRTEGNIVPIALALIATNLPWVAGLVGAVYFYPEFELPALPLTIAVNVAVNLGFVATWFCMVATYVLLRPTHELEEVFA